MCRVALVATLVLLTGCFELFDTPCEEFDFLGFEGECQSFMECDDGLLVRVDCEEDDFDVLCTCFQNNTETGDQFSSDDYCSLNTADRFRQAEEACGWQKYRVGDLED